MIYIHNKNNYGPIIHTGDLQLKQYLSHFPQIFKKQKSVTSYYSMHHFAFLKLLC